MRKSAVMKLSDLSWIYLRQEIENPDEAAIIEIIFIHLIFESHESNFSISFWE